MEGFGENFLPQPGLDRVLENEVHPDVEQLLEEHLEIHVGIERFRVELDHEVEIALRARDAPGARSEETQSADAIAADRRSLRLARPEYYARGEVHGRFYSPWYLGCF